MSGRKKHRVIVEVAFDRNVTAKHAVRSVIDGLVVDFMDSSNVCVTTVKVKEAERVLQAEIRNRQRVLK